MSTTALIVKRTLLTVLAAVHASDVEDVEVLYGPPDVETLKLPRLVAVGGVEAGLSPLDSLDLGTAGEMYVVRVQTAVDLRAVAGSAGQQLATEAVLDLYTREEAYLRDGHDGALGLGSFGVLGIRPTDQWALLERATETGRTAAVNWGVQVIGQRQ